MLDRSLPYYNLVMTIPRAHAAALPVPALPNGFRLRRFQRGDEAHWARIEASVGEFPSPEAALGYFSMFYLPHQEQLMQRSVFALAPSGLPVATATAWYAEDAALGRQPSLHWVAVQPQYQQMGLGRAVSQEATRLLGLLESADAVLHTQTWSHRALWMYYTLGWRLSQSAVAILTGETPGQTRLSLNEYNEALPHLQRVLPPQRWALLAGSVLL